MATQQEKETLTSTISAALSAVESNLDTIIDSIPTAYTYGMVSKPERDRHLNRFRQLKYRTFECHGDLTEISVREGTDGVIAAGGPGR